MYETPAYCRSFINLEGGKNKSTSKSNLFDLTSRKQNNSKENIKNGSSNFTAKLKHFQNVRRMSNDNPYKISLNTSRYKNSSSSKIKDQEMKSPNISAIQKEYQTGKSKISSRSPYKNRRSSEVNSLSKNRLNLSKISSHYKLDTSMIHDMKSSKLRLVYANPQLNQTKFMGETKQKYNINMNNLTRVLQENYNLRSSNIKELHKKNKNGKNNSKQIIKNENESKPKINSKPILITNKKNNERSESTKKFIKKVGKNPNNRSQSRNVPIEKIEQKEKVEKQKIEKEKLIIKKELENKKPIEIINICKEENLYNLVKCPSKAAETKCTDTGKNEEENEDKRKLISYIENHVRSFKEIPHTTIDNYRIIKIIGKGAFAKVTLAEHKLTGRPVAIKIIKKACMRDQHRRKKVLTEVYIQKKMQHQNIVKLLEVFEGQNHLFIIVEYGAGIIKIGGDLLQYIKSTGRLQESEARHMFRQIVLGVAHIHCHSVIHRDIKLDNIILDSRNKPKICDFGVSKIISKDQIIDEQCGTPAYLAPEIALNNAYDGFYADHWSLGIVLYAMVCASVPYKAENLEELKESLATTELSFPPYLSDSVKDLITGLLNMEPHKRYSLVEILSHPWMLLQKEKSLSYDDCEKMDAPKKKSNPNINCFMPSNLFYENCQSASLRMTDYKEIMEEKPSKQIDDKIVDMIESYGYERGMIINSLKKDEINHVNSTYQLLKLKNQLPLSQIVEELSIH